MRDYGIFLWIIEHIFLAVSNKTISVSIFNLCFLFKEAKDQSMGGAHTIVEICLSQFGEKTGGCVEQADQIFLDVL